MEFMQAWDGHTVRRWMVENVDVVGYICGCYLTLVFTGPKLFARLKGRGEATAAAPEKRSEDSLGFSAVRRAMVLWNLGLSIFSIFGTSTVTPTLVRNIVNKGFYEATCTFNEEEFYTTSVGFWMGIFALSKIPELMDTVFLVLQGKQPLPFLHWYHHVTVLLFSWHTYCVGSSGYIWVAAMNYSVHSIMYLYFAIAVMGYKSLVRPLAPYITLMQISQMVMGCFVTLYAMRASYEGRGCGMSWSNMRIQLLMYASYLYLFSEMFVKAHVLPRPKPVAGTVNGPTKKSN
ncbi:fatty acid elongase [Trypanosoma rangeli]|uniref:Elongation of fatty acids protein n=1 Tax=Trypanosoma rangeli TaxID=5698 RepID=A0A3R7NSQ3_TRYRA|nr:fatty acid elongase [Trypanosoma rangeli]RNF07091.1 fatty acid elongase [Trypanosoma rangeli]|eukprot:RNF07091.1 fatty acid elongase [Trypanosoma rangeli]